MSHTIYTYGKNYKVRKCPGCGEEANRPEGVLCLDCQHLLELGKEVKLARSRGTSFYGVNNPHIWIKRFDGSQYSYPSINVRDEWDTWGFGKNEVPKYRIHSEGITRALKDVILSVNLDEIKSEPNFKERERAGWLFPDVHPFYGGVPFVRLRHKTAWQFSMLHQIIQGTIQDAYNTGYKDGSNVIRSMLDGRFSVEKMNQLSLGIEVQEDDVHE